jgi:hypothetical protein
MCSNGIVGGWFCLTAAVVLLARCGISVRSTLQTAATWVRVLVGVGILLATGGIVVVAAMAARGEARLAQVCPADGG